MSNYQQLISDYDAYTQVCPALFGEQWRPASLQSVVVERTRQELDRTGLQQALGQLGDVEGWMLLSDQRIVLQQQAASPEDSLVLSAELYQEGRSVRVRQLHGNRWLLVTTCIVPDSGQSGTHLATQITHLANEPGLGRLEYQQLWSRNEQGRLYIEDAVFTGFTGA
ncbi:MAG: hypothetical protein GXZ05_01210 [Gammaproteobacteria bacterium]|nr:hypothetical protein [Gammaproteobacteria bacterium]